MVLVNTNPLYTSHELEHQLNDSGAKLIVTLANFAKELEEIVEKTSLQKVVVSEVADLLPQPKRTLINFSLKYVMRQVPKLHFNNAIRFLDVFKDYDAKSPTEVNVSPKDVAVLQYTGGTTGVAKGVMLSHDNLISCMRQVECVYSLAGWELGRSSMVTPLPLYHIYAFSISFTHSLNIGHCNILIIDPRNIKAFVKVLKKARFDGLTGLNTLFSHLMDNPDFRNLDFSKFKLVLSGGMALSKNIADRWSSITGSEICEGYGLTESSGILNVNNPQSTQLGTVGVSLPGNKLKIIDDEGNALPCGVAGELLFKGPSQMQGYWGRDEATQELLDDEGYMRTGDIAIMSPEGLLSIVDRAKDMIIVSGFNVYPNEIEDVVIGHPDIQECAAIAGNGDNGEYVRLFAVSLNPDLTEKELRDYCREYLSAYKVPKKVVFVGEMPKSNVGKILRRELRELYPE
ncbi:UNVERIFIED_CONTAM: hypothetical protein GTU68_039561 [Idotea baltica]|nr:hypothetical protein [Idotea baltica]